MANSNYTEPINTTEIKIKVFKECRTCKHINFLDDWETAKCAINDEVVIEKAFQKEQIAKDPCDKWDFDYTLFEEADCNFIDLNNREKR